MERARLHLLLLIGLLALASIVCGEPTPTPTGPPEAESIGTIRRENTRVQYGTSLAQLAELTNARPLLSESALRVTNGGEALLDFSAGLVVRAFNNANMSVALSTDPSPYLLRFYLERSVATGELAAAGEAISWETPNGAQITISGTEFFVAFDPTTDRTLVGNFNGTIDIAHPSLPGGVAAIPGGEGYEIPGGPFTLPPGLTRARFESTIRGLSDPLDEPRSYPTAASGRPCCSWPGGEPFTPCRCAPPWFRPCRGAILIAESTGTDPDTLDLLLAQASTPTRTTSANELAYNPDEADRHLPGVPLHAAAGR